MEKLVSFTAGSTADIDALIEDKDLIQYKGKGMVWFKSWITYHCSRYGYCNTI
jgi:hypothetical protein